jgi:hypothetical protein
MLKLLTNSDKETLIVNSFINFSIDLLISAILYSIFTFLIPLKALPVSLTHPSMSSSYIVLLFLY